MQFYDINLKKKAKAVINMSIPRSEHPNPQFMRKSWQNLNGCWEFEIDSGRSGIDRRFYERDSLSQSIIVPCQAEFFYTLVLWITKP